MEILCEYKSSDEDEEEVVASAPPPVVQPPPTIERLSDGERERRRQAVAAAFARQETEATNRRRLTPAEQSFAFRGYASKRRRRDTSDAQPPPEQPPLPQPPSLFFTAESDARDEEEGDDTDVGARRRLPTRVVRRFAGHMGAVNCVQWNTSPHSQLFLSASMDASVRVWDLRRETCRRALKLHAKGVRSARWSLDGAHVLSASYDGRAIYANAETGAALCTYAHDQSEPTAVTSVSAHPSDSNLFLVGTDRGTVFSHDLRQSEPCRTYRKGFGDVHDLLFLSGSGERFVSSAGIKYRDASHQTLLVWDFASGALLSDRLDRDMQPFSCLRLHPREPRFVAQSSANYALFFSALEPFKRVNKGKSRFAGGHEVQGYSVQCSFNADGSVLATGDANGRVFYYDSTSKRVLRRLEPFGRSGRSVAPVCVCAEFRPRSNANALVAGAFDGQLVLLE